MTGRLENEIWGHIPEKQIKADFVTDKTGINQETFPESKEGQLLSDINDIDKVAQKFGLDYFDTVFNRVSADGMYEGAAYGLPGRHTHWTFGKDYYREKTKYNFGLSKFYELVFNTDPAVAYFMDNNSRVENKLIIGHVLAHVDFFKNNTAFKNTDRKMAESATRFSRDLDNYREEFGEERVEDFLDAVKSIEYYVDPDAENGDKKEEKHKKTETMSPFADILEIGEEKPVKKQETSKKPVPEKDTGDLLLFIAQNSPDLEDWQRDILLKTRTESLYFLPQIKTKIMNEGWASFWHKRILRELGELDNLKPGEDIDWMVLDSDVMVPHQKDINPYYVGWKVWEDIERKHKGLPRPDGKSDKDMWGVPIDPLIYKGDDTYDIFRVREETVSDQEFLRTFLTGPLIDELILPFFKPEEESLNHMDEVREKAKQVIINKYDNFGMPDIKVAAGGGDYNHNKELYLQHNFDGRPLDPVWTDKTLRQIRKVLWNKPVHLETVSDGKKALWTCQDEKSDIKRKML